MGKTMKPVPFFTDDITVTPHTATEARHIGRPVTMRDFAAGEPLSLYKVDTGELYARTNSGRFIEGPEYMTPDMPAIRKR